MLIKTVLLALVGLSSWLGVLSEAAFAQEKKPDETAQPVVSQLRQGEALLELIDNSPTLSQALAINQSGAIIGVREKTNPEQTIFSMTYFYCDQQQSTDLPLLEGFTNTEAFALSDNGLVVGLASRPVGTAGGSLTAIVWDSTSGKISNLGFPEGYSASHAQDISADGTRITGYVNGAEPVRMQPCVWDWNATDKVWENQVLVTKFAYNPFIMTSRVIVSPDGKRIAACCVYRMRENRGESALYTWQEKDGAWEPKLLLDSAFFLRDMNNRGLIVGFQSKVDLKFPCFVDDSQLKFIDLLPGDESGEAWGVNSEGTIVGFSDDPRGPIGGPQAFRWKAGATAAIDFGDAPYSAAYSINDSNQIAGMLDVVRETESGTLEKTLSFRTLPEPGKP